MILIIDNYDSFVENLARYVRELGFETTVVRNDRITLTEIEQLDPTHIILSPGPGMPDEAGICLNLINKFAGHIPLLGVCLGHQAIAQAFGGEVIPSGAPIHGKASTITHHHDLLFKNIPSPFKGGRYHSLVATTSFNVIAEDEQGAMMGIKHPDYDVYGVQFHPESVLTEHGHQLLRNFIEETSTHAT